jgi:hypothetical protein
VRLEGRGRPHPSRRRLRRLLRMRPTKNTNAGIPQSRRSQPPLNSSIRVATNSVTRHRSRPPPRLDPALLRRRQRRSDQRSGRRANGATDRGARAARRGSANDRAGCATNDRARSDILLAHRLTARQHGRHCTKKQDFLHCSLPRFDAPQPFDVLEPLKLPTPMLCGGPACGQSLLRRRAAFPADLRRHVTKKHQRL